MRMRIGRAGHAGSVWMTGFESGAGVCASAAAGAMRARTSADIAFIVLRSCLPRRSLRLDARFTRDLRVLANVGFEKCGEFFGRRSDRLEIEQREAFEHVRHLHELACG